jgi:hypothetical protein
MDGNSFNATAQGIQDLSLALREAICAPVENLTMMGDAPEQAFTILTSLSWIP